MVRFATIFLLIAGLIACGAKKENKGFAGDGSGLNPDVGGTSGASTSDSTSGGLDYSAAFDEGDVDVENLSMSLTTLFKAHIKDGNRIAVIGVKDDKKVKTNCQFNDGDVLVCGSTA